MIRVIKECNEILDFAWELCQDNTKVSYPRLNTKEEFQNMIDRAITLDSRRAIGYYEDNKLTGVCMYYWIDEEKYAQTNALLIKDNYNLAVDEIMAYMKGHLEGYSIYVGITADNKEAIDYFEERKVPCADASCVTKLIKRDFKLQAIKHEITKLKFEDFKEYTKFHDKYSAGIYWNGEHLEEAFDDFVIFVYKDDMGIKGSIFTKINNREADIVGLFIDDGEKGKGIEEDLIGATLKYLYEEYNDVEETLYFIEDDSKEELSWAMKHGFKINDRYRLYVDKL